MALKIPLVMGSSGFPQQLQPGDSVNTPETKNFVADAAMVGGNAVYPSAAGHMGLAKADSLTTAKMAGAAVTTISNAGTGAIQMAGGGILSQATSLWDAIAGTTGGLTADTVYFLSDATAGQLTATPPTTVGHFVVQYGIGLSTTDMLLAAPNIIGL